VVKLQARVMIATVRVGKGWMTIAYTEGPEVVSNSLVSKTQADSKVMVIRDLRGRNIEAHDELESPQLQEVAARILSGDPTVPISRCGISDFRWRAFEFVRRIPKGKVASYSDVARGIGKPKAQRAVGTAMATHCLTYIIPCHRVVKNDLSPGKFSSTQSKTEMLKAEGIGMEKGRIRERHRLVQGK
jgi:O-6-methylguanine DNA methyltransferase